MKIKHIHINNYRAFLVNGDQEIKRYTIDLPQGENLLIYGENGSGKSSLFRALKDFLNSASAPGQAFQRNLFYEEAINTEQPFIDIVTDDNSHHRFSADGNQYILVDKTEGNDTNYITEANIINGFVSYRDLLKLHYRQADQEPDLVSMFLGEDGLFSNMMVPAPAKVENKVSFKALWEKCQLSDQDAITDYNNNVISLFEELEKKANILLNVFHKECSLKIDYIAAQLGNNTGKPHVTYLPLVSFRVSLFGKEIPGHNDLLNEARLTALAISIFLAHQLCRPATDLRILFLDDIFIGLDMSNRLPLIDILTADDLGDGLSFKDFQIFLTTYDREWFNVAKTYLQEGWHKIEFYVDRHNSSVDRPLIRKSDTYGERAKFHFIQSDYPASANYLRKAFEQTLRNILPENALYTRLGTAESEISQITISKQQLSMKETEHSWFFLAKTPSGISGSQPRPASLNSLIEMFRALVNDYKIPFPYLEELIKIKNRLLNPLSHDDLKSPIFKTELESGFLVLEELLKVKSKLIIDISIINPAFLFFHEQDLSGQQYRYKFQLLENLRYVEYGGTGKLLNAECKPIYRRLLSNNIKEENLGNNRKSVYEFCKAVKIYLTQSRTIAINQTSLLNDIFMENGKALSTLI